MLHLVSRFWAVVMAGEWGGIGIGQEWEDRSDVMGCWPLLFRGVVACKCRQQWRHQCWSPRSPNECNTSLSIRFEWCAADWSLRPEQCQHEISLGDEGG